MTAYRTATALTKIFGAPKGVGDVRFDDGQMTRAYNPSPQIVEAGAVVVVACDRFGNWWIVGEEN